MTHQRTWLDNYPAGVPADIDLEKYQSIGDVFDTAVQRFSPRPALSSFGKEVSYAQLDVLVEQTQADELIFTCDLYEHADRIHSYELLSQVMKEA